MSKPADGPRYAVGWDVGGWNCANNRASRDAIAILDADGRLVGSVWRGNLSPSILDATDGRRWIEALFALCETGPPPREARVTIGIDTPLGFSDEFVALLGGRAAGRVAAESAQNPYLYRLTERLLADEGRAPLSPIKDMIGSQATKGMHALAKFAPVREAVGVWTDESRRLVAFETYPTVSRDTARVVETLAAIPEQSPQDKQDALVCAAVARLFDESPEKLVAPPAGAPVSEGWIRRPKR